MSRRSVLIFTFAGLLIPVTFNSCGFAPDYGKNWGTSTVGNPMTPFAIASYSSSSGLTLCMSRLTLKPLLGADVVIPFISSQERDIPASGIDLESFMIPPGTYSQVLLESSDSCGTGRSMGVVNEQGNFNAAQSVTLKFVGQLTIGSIPKKINLQIQPIANDLDTVTSDSDILVKATADVGSLSLGSCGMQLADAPTASFCETFDQPFAVTGRSAQLDANIWSVSRITGNSNIAQGTLDGWLSSTINACDGSHPAQPDNSDIIICNGQMRESSSDGGQVTNLAMSLKQSFDFSNRIGTVAFDVSNDTSGVHGTWPEFWITDQPIPAPATHGGIPCDYCSIPRNGLGIRFAAAEGDCPGGWRADSVVIVRNYVVEEHQIFDSSTGTQIRQNGCASLSSGPSGGLNHVELRISQNQIDVFASDAGSAILRLINTISSANLSFTKGFISLVDAHFDASQSPNPATANHTFTWDNVAFDGPANYRNLSFDVLDALTPNGVGSLNLGWVALVSTPASLISLPITAANIAAAKSALLVFNFGGNPIATINYTVNGHAFSVPSPFTGNYPWNSIAVPLPLSSLVQGTQNIQISGDLDMTVANVTVVLVDAVPIP